MHDQQNIKKYSLIFNILVDWRVGLAFLCSLGLPEDGTMVLKHSGFGTYH